MPIEEKEDRICLKANKTLVCEVNARTVVISDGEDGKLIQIRTHTRFVHFPVHNHNFVEVVYMCHRGSGRLSAVIFD